MTAHYTSKHGQVAKRPEEMSKGIIMAIMVEFYAILCLLATFLMLNGLPYEALTM